MPWWVSWYFVWNVTWYLVVPIVVASLGAHILMRRFWPAVAVSTVAAVLTWTIPWVAARGFERTLVRSTLWYSAFALGGSVLIGAIVWRVRRGRRSG